MRSPGRTAGRACSLIGDLGSAIMTAETAVELLDPAPAGGVLVLDVPLVEGGVAAAVAAEGGGDLAAVAAAARTAGGTPVAEARRAYAHGTESGTGPASATVVLADPEGLHARPAAELVKLAGRFAARIQVNGRDARSLLGILALGLRKGDRVRIEADGPDAAEAVDAVRDLLESTPG